MRLSYLLMSGTEQDTYIYGRSHLFGILSHFSNENGVYPQMLASIFAIPVFVFTKLPFQIKENPSSLVQTEHNLLWMSKLLPNLSCVVFHADVKLSKRRQPFVPYALRNHTGCTMWFATLTTTPTR